jgi:hypothetical protein
MASHGNNFWPLPVLLSCLATSCCYPLLLSSSNWRQLNLCSLLRAQTAYKTLPKTVPLLLLTYLLPRDRSNWDVA